MAKKASFFYAHFWLLLLTLKQSDVVGDGAPVRRVYEKNLWTPSLSDGPDHSRPLKLEFGGQAANWTDAIPIGNGRLGAMVWGGVASEILQLNEDTLWTGVPGDYTKPEALEVLSRVRKLVDDGNYTGATEEAVNLSHTPSDVFQPLGDIKLDFDKSHHNFNRGSYHRELDLETATARVEYSVDDVDFSREHFASYPDQVIATKISSSKPKSLSFTVSMDSKLHHHTEANSKTNQILLQGSCRGKRLPRKMKKKPDNSTEILYDKPKGIQFSAILELRVSEGSSISSLDGRKFKIENADWVVLVLTASSSFDGPFVMPPNSKKDPSSNCIKRLNSIRKFSYSDLYARHLDDYQNLFNRVSLRISKDSKNGNGTKIINESVSTQERVKSFKNDEDPSFVELLFQYGRYLLISCSRPGSQVANLQGIWNKDVSPPWDGAPHLNINLQMNYWHSLSCNLRECQEPLFDYISSLSINGQKTAKVNYGANGWVAHQVSDIWAKTSPDRGSAVWALWPMGGAWLSTHLWEHYTYTLDKEFLRNRAYPVLEGCTLFLVDWLIEGRGGYLETNPSTSPEHMFIAPDGKPASVSNSSTMDISIISEVFSTIVSASKVLGKTNDVLVQKVIKIQERLPPIRVGKDGCVMEWSQDFEDPEVHHRHVSHLFGQFPGHTVTLKTSPELSKAAEHTLIKRGEEGPGWSTTWKTALWARLQNADRAYQMIKHLVNLVDPLHEANFEGGLYSNLFSAHPPFQIDANFGFAAAIAEMLVQSTVDELHLLPALPQDKWPEGCVKGLKARGGVTVGICWKDGRLQEFGLWSEKHSYVGNLRYGENVAAVSLSVGRVYTFDGLLRCIKTDRL